MQLWWDHNVKTDTSTMEDWQQKHIEFPSLLFQKRAESDSKSAPYFAHCVTTVCYFFSTTNSVEVEEIVTSLLEDRSETLAQLTETYISNCVGPPPTRTSKSRSKVGRPSKATTGKHNPPYGPAVVPTVSGAGHPYSRYGTWWRKELSRQEQRQIQSHPITVSTRSVTPPMTITASGNNQLPANQYYHALQQIPVQPQPQQQQQQEQVWQQPQYFSY